jgi:hypothetical protein
MEPVYGLIMAGIDLINAQAGPLDRRRIVMCDFEFMLTLARAFRPPPPPPPAG